MNNSIHSTSHLQGHYAGFTSRLLAIFIDILIIIFLFIAIGWFLTSTFTLMNNSGLFGISLLNIGFIQNIKDFLFSPVFIGTFIHFFIFCYSTFFTTITGHTPGKAILGLRVVPMQGGKMSFVRSTLRFFAYIPTILSLGIGFFWIIIDDQRQAWHDSISRTYVVYTWKARPDEYFLHGDMNEFPNQPREKKFTSQTINKQ